MLHNKREIGFDVDAYTARLIGRENVSKIEGAILELAKNAYDADASIVCFYYDSQTHSLLIMDNGEGMSEDVIRHHWMTVGSSSKKSSFVSANGRVKTGAKGIGRFALDRISDYCQMWTSTKDKALVWDVCWNDFSDNRSISEVKARLYDTDDTMLSFAEIDKWNNRPMAERLSQPEARLQGTGTVFKLTGLHDDWSESMQNKVRRHLENLLPPAAVENFEIYFFNEKTGVESAEIHSNSIEQFDYKIIFQVTDDTLSRSSELNIKLIRNEFDVVGKVDLSAAGFALEDEAYFLGQAIQIKRPLRQVVSQPGGDNIIGRFDGMLYFNKVVAPEKERKKYYYKDFAGRKNFTKEFGGIKIYRDCFRVRPYGEYGSSDFDWLELSSRRNKQPAAISHGSGRWRVGSEQIMGIINISRYNANLEDDANRNGLQDGPGLVQLKEILLAVIDEFERDRQYVGRKLDQYYKKQSKIQHELDELERLAEQRKRWEEESSQKTPEYKLPELEESTHPSIAAPAANPIQIHQLFQDAMEEKNQEIQELLNEIKMLQTLATTRIVMNKFMHEIRTLTNNIGVELNSAYEALVYDNDPAYAMKQIRRAVGNKKHFTSWFNITIGAVSRDKRHRKNCSICEILADFMDSWQAVLKKCGAELEFSCDPQLKFRCFALDLENILSNLISNSVSSFERVSPVPLDEKKIMIYILETENHILQIDYQDTGWGLSNKYKMHPERTLEAFETDKVAVDGSLDEEGTGMGMWIVNQIARDYQGVVDLSDNKTKERGYHAVITLGGSNV